jgi:hypothetical protein
VQKCSSDFKYRVSDKLTTFTFYTTYTLFLRVDGKEFDPIRLRFCDAVTAKCHRPSATGRQHYRRRDGKPPEAHDIRVHPSRRIIPFAEDIGLMPLGDYEGVCRQVEINLS